MSRIEIVMNALDVEKEDAEKIVAHLTKHDCLDWIDNYNEENGNEEPLVDVHFEYTFEDMIDWKFEDYQPSEMLGKSSNIEDYPEMLELEDEIIFWYGLV